MTVSPDVVLVSIAIGVPLMLLALGVLYHARVLSQHQRDVDERAETLATESSEELIQELQTAMRELQGGLRRQRTSMGGFLSDAPREPERPGRGSPEMTMAALGASASAGSVPPVTMLTASEVPGGDLPLAVQRFSAEGLSDRAIARRLHIRLEEVRMVRARSGRRA